MTTLQPTSGGASAGGLSSSSWKTWLPAMVAIALLAGLAIGVPGLFTVRSIQNMLIQIGPLGLVALGQCLVILVRGLDLSVASVMATAAVIAASFGPSPGAFPIVVVCVLAMSVTVGAVNGLLVTKRKLEPFLVTLATMIMLQGIRSAVTEGAPLGDTPMIVRELGRGIVWGIPINAILLGVTACVLALILRRTVIGRKVYIVGTNDRAAFLAGIHPDRVRIGCYIGCSVLAGMAGVVLAGYLDQVDNWVGRGYELDSIVAAVLGGVALAGGKGGAFGALAGAVLLILLSNAILHLGIPVEFQMIMKGVIVVGAVAFYAVRGR
jgi:ribose/xylose/arabinose/galactoside ABC-type transport system permease subunit